MTRGRRALSIALPAAAAGAAWAATWRHDRRLIAADPMHEVLEAPLEGRRLPVASADGTALHAEAFGPEDGPTLVLVHGWTCALRFWTCQIQELARELRVVAYDLRGHGHSAAGHDGDYSMEAHAADLDAVLRAAGDGPVVVAGHSMGAMALVAWAGEHAAEVGSRLAGAALVNTGVGDLITESLVLRTPVRMGRAQQALGRAMLSASAPLPKGSTPISHRAVRDIALCRAASPATIAFCERLILECRRDVRAACGATMSRLDLRESVASLDVPTLVVAGARDRLTPPVHARRLAEALPRLTELVELPRVGHMAPVEAPGDVTSRLRELVAATTAGRDAVAA